MQTIILAIETATNACSVALISGERLYSRYQVEPQIHTKVILDMVNEVINEADVQLADIDAFAFGQGPGSFTGLRIAASVIQGLAFGVEKPVVPVSSLAALAQLGFNQTGKKKILAVIDARMGEIYWGTYLANEQGLVEPEIKDKLTKEIDIDPTDYLAVGMNNSEIEYPRATEIAQLALEKFAKGEGVPASEAVPVYLRNDVVGSKKNPD